MCCCASPNVNGTIGYQWQPKDKPSMINEVRINRAALWGASIEPTTARAAAALSEWREQECARVHPALGPGFVSGALVLQRDADVERVMQSLQGHDLPWRLRVSQYLSAIPYTCCRVPHLASRPIGISVDTDGS